MSSNNELRKINYWDGRNHVQAYFHLWGTRNFLAEDGNDFPITVGIIELSNGKIVEAEPKHIQFVY